MNPSDANQSSDSTPPPPPPPPFTPPPAAPVPTPPPPSTPVTPPRPPVYTPPAGEPPKKSSMPWVLGGCGCFTVIFIVVAIICWMVYRAKQRVNEFQTNVKSTLEQAAREQRRTASSPAATTTPLTQTSVARAGWNIYVNEKDKLPSGLQSKFVAFSFQYPRTFELQPQSDANFIKVEKYAPAGKPNTAENFAVGYARFDDPNAVSEALYDQLLDQLGKQIGAGFHNYKEVKRNYTTIDGTKSRTALFQADFANAPQIQIFGKTIVVHPPGKAYGVTILMLGTSMSRDIKSADDLGTKGDTADIVRSFSFL
jgi:hypothetical protein